MLHGLFGEAREYARARQRTIIAADAHIWIWPGIALTTHCGGEIIAKSAEMGNG